MKTIDIIIKYINDKTSTYKILREYISYHMDIGMLKSELYPSIV